MERACAKKDVQAHCISSVNGCLREGLLAKGAHEALIVQLLSLHLHIGTVEQKSAHIAHLFFFKKKVFRKPIRRNFGGKY